MKALALLETCWKPRLKFLESLNPSRLILDFSRIGCSTDCCRESLIDNIAVALIGWKYLRGQHGPNVISFSEGGGSQKDSPSKSRLTLVGLQDEEERKQIRQGLESPPDEDQDADEAGSYFHQALTAAEEEEDSVQGLDFESLFSTGLEMNENSGDLRARMRAYSFE